MRLVVISGLSGSGKSVALRTLEDLGYYCIDNLPASLLEPFAVQLTQRVHPGLDKAAVSIDARNQLQDLEKLQDILATLPERGIQPDILFLEAQDATLLKRFSETRRKHPLTRLGVPLQEAIRQERTLLEPLAARASLFIDTTHTNIHELRDMVRQRLAEKTEGVLSLLFRSFGYKHGIPEDADFVFDVRCLPNPHWEAPLRPLTGLDRPVAEYLERSPLVDEMYEHIRGFLETWIPRFQAENRSYLTVAVGCTGGQHRSVYMVTRLAEYFQKRLPSVLTRHREL